MKNVLVATDFSKRSDAAVSRGAALAKAHGATLTVLHIVDDDQSEKLATAAHEQARGLLEDLSRDLQRDYGIEPAITVARGEPHAEILNAAEKAGADLIIIGSHRRNVLRDVFVGTTAERTIRASRTPVLLARLPGAATYQHPLIALDLNEHELFPLEVSQSLKLFEPDSKTVFFAYSLHDNYRHLKRAGATEAELNSYIKDAENKVRTKIGRLLDGETVDPSRIVIKPAALNTHDPILDFSSENDNDLIVVGTKRKQAFERLKLGSVSEAILRRADIDVLVVPPTD